MPKLNIYKSKGRSKAQTIYLGGLCVLRNRQGIRVSHETDIAYCPKGTDIYDFFDKILKRS